MRAWMTQVHVGNRPDARTQCKQTITQQPPTSQPRTRTPTTPGLQWPRLQTHPCSNPRIKHLWAPLGDSTHFWEFPSAHLHSSFYPRGGGNRPETPLDGASGTHAGGAIQKGQGAVASRGQGTQPLAGGIPRNALNTIHIPTCPTNILCVGSISLKILHLISASS